MTHRVRILSYNIHKGFAMGNVRFVLHQMKQAIRSVSADLVFLQEVIGAHAQHAGRVVEWPSESQFEFLADEAWSHYAYGQNAVYDAGHHGNAILSCWPIAEWSNLNVSTNAFEQRGILHAVVQSPEGGKRVNCLCLHFNMLKRGRMRQVAQLCDRIAAAVPADEPLIIAGDFNDWSELATGMLTAEHEIQDAFQVATGFSPRTFPAWFPVLKLDRIYVRGAKVISAERLCGEPWRSLSDHVPLLVEIECP